VHDISNVNRCSNACPPNACTLTVMLLSTKLVPMLFKHTYSTFKYTCKRKRYTVNCRAHMCAFTTRSWTTQTDLCQHYCTIMSLVHIRVPLSSSMSKLCTGGHVLDTNPLHVVYPRLPVKRHTTVLLDQSTHKSASETQHSEHTLPQCPYTLKAQMSNNDLRNYALGIAR
jgi:hypothetical protein